MPLSAVEIREKFLRHFEARDHRILPSASLVPDSDPSLMFANSGMVPFKRTFLGEETRSYSRATTSQKCMRVSGKHNDLEEVGRSSSHHTFFEMLGNFSFGDYFKREAIQFAWELLTGSLGLEPERLVISVFREDDEAFDLWRDEQGVAEPKIFRLDEAENFWSMGDTGPCGPCSEVHVDFGATGRCTSDVCDPSCDCGRYLEIWNLVFMQFSRDAQGRIEPLPKPSIDTGAGLERLSRVLQGVSSTYETDLFVPLLNCAQDLTGVALGDDPERDVSLRVIADHARAVAFLIGDGVLPSNEGRGYVLRRILRRSLRHGVLLGLEEPFLHRVTDVVIDEMTSAYPDLGERRAYIGDRVRREEERFLETLSRGLTLLEGEIGEAKARQQTQLPGVVVFRLYDTYGFPIDLTADILRSHEMTVDQEGFDTAMQAQRVRARAAWKGSGDSAASEIYNRVSSDVKCEFRGYETLELDARVAAILVDGTVVERARVGDAVELVFAETPFYAESGGQVGDAGVVTSEGGRVEIEDTQSPVDGLIVHRGRVVEGEIALDTLATLAVDAAKRQATVRNHTGTHLLHAALRQVLGPQAMQKGSLVAPDRLRFDFTHDAPLTAEEIARIEDLSNEWVERNATLETRTLPYPEAIAAGAIAIFEEKYGEQVRVVAAGDFSTELCGGTHAGATGEIGLIKILSESGIAAGVRRIEALTGMDALRQIRDQERWLSETAQLLKSPPAEVPGRVERLLEERREAQRKLEQLGDAQRGSAASELLSQVREIEGGHALAARVDGLDAKSMRSMVDDLRAKLGSGVVLLASEAGGKVLLAVGVTQDLVSVHRAGDLIRETASLVGGGGGGRPDFAQAGGRDAAGIDAAIARFLELVGAG